MYHAENLVGTECDGNEILICRLLTLLVSTCFVCEMTEFVIDLCLD